MAEHEARFRFVEVDKGADARSLACILMTMPSGTKLDNVTERPESAMLRLYNPMWSIISAPVDDACVINVLKKHERRLS